jgi:hypothetical protein
MELPAVMNVQEVAVNKAVQEHANTEVKKEQSRQVREAAQAKEMFQANATTLSTVGQHAIDPKSLTIRVERKGNSQSAKETVRQPEDTRKSHTGGSGMGGKIDLFA